MAPETAGQANRPTPPDTAARRGRLLLAYAYLTTLTVIGWFTIGGYAIAVVTFTVGYALLILAFRALQVWATNSIRRHVDTALTPVPAQRRVS